MTSRVRGGRVMLRGGVRGEGGAHDRDPPEHHRHRPSSRGAHELDVQPSRLPGCPSSTDRRGCHRLAGPRRAPRFSFFCRRRGRSPAPAARRGHRHVRAWGRGGEAWRGPKCHSLYPVCRAGRRDSTAQTRTAAIVIPPLPSSLAPSPSPATHRPRDASRCAGRKWRARAPAVRSGQAASIARRR